MNQQEQILAAYLKEELPDFEISRKEDKQILILLSESLSFKKKATGEETYRDVTIKEDSDGKISAYSIKLFNVLHVDLDKQINFLAKAGGILTIASMLKFTLGFLGILAFFIPMRKLEFNEQDAKVLLAIYKLHKKEFSQSEIGHEFQVLNFEPIEPNRMNASLVKLANARVLKSLGHGRYLKLEKIEITR